MRYRQFTNQGCLPTSLMMLKSIEHSKTDELKLVHDGFARVRETYALGIIEAFANTYNVEMTILADNKWYQKELNRLSSSSLLTIIYKPITPEHLQQMVGHFVAYIDNHEFGAYEHSPHFVVVTTLTKSKVSMHDPWTGKSQIITTKRLHRAITSLKTHLRYCPIVVY